jgi:hypothetical protein
VEGERGEGWVQNLFGNLEFVAIPALNPSAVERVQNEVNDALSALTQTLNALVRGLTLERELS